MKYTFSGQSVLVTGAASGIGEATARLLAANGLSVVVSDIHPESVQRVVAAITAAGGTAIANLCDVSKADQVQAAVETAVQRFGGLHYAVNNAGIGGQAGAVGEMSLDAWQQVVDVNLNGVACATRSRPSSPPAAGRSSTCPRSSAW